MPKKNIEYKSAQIRRFYSSNRQRWDEFYPSERWVFDRIAGDKKHLGDVLDVGCACGGLGSALLEKFDVDSYTGIDINKDAIEWARRKRRLSVPATFLAGDIIGLKLKKEYDVVFSLSCADWNLETKKMIDECWKKVKKEGYLVISLRLTAQKGINNIKKSYQYINFYNDESKPEVANYVVFNFKDVVNIMKELNLPPRSIGAYGYWGKPSSMAVTPFKKLVFAVFYLRKSGNIFNGKIGTEFNLPLEVYL